MNLKNFLLTKTPPQFRFFLVNMKNRLWGGYKQVHYSQNGEDIVLSFIFKTLKKDRGFYVDVGAHHPQRYSNTHLLYLNGWHGINIDPNPETIRLFNSDRKRDINLAIGIAAHQKEMQYFSFSDPALNTFSEVAAQKYEGKTWVSLIRKSGVKVLPLRDVLQSHVPKDCAIDLLNVDVEGLDLEVLQSNDWDTFQPQVIVVEDHKFDLREPSKSELYVFLVSKSYRLHAYIGFSLIFIKDSL